MADYLHYLRFIVEDVYSVVLATTDAQGAPRTCVIDMMLYDQDGLYFLTAKGKSLYERLTASASAHARRQDPALAIDAVDREGDVPMGAMGSGMIALTALCGESTMQSKSVNLQGQACEVGPALLDKIFAHNPYMAEIYPTEQSRQALTVFQIYCGQGEFFDLSVRPIFRESFAFDARARQTRFGTGIGTVDGNVNIDVSAPHVVTVTGAGAGANTVSDINSARTCDLGAAATITTYMIDASKCDGCGQCLKFCPQQCIVSSCLGVGACQKASESRGVEASVTSARTTISSFSYRIQSEHCLLCGECSLHCPRQAISKATIAATSLR